MTSDQEAEWHIGFQPRGDGQNFEFVCRCADSMHREMVPLVELLDLRQQREAAEAELTKAIAARDANYAQRNKLGAEVAALRLQLAAAREALEAVVAYLDALDREPAWGERVRAALSEPQPDA